MNTFIASIFLLLTYALSGCHKPDNNSPEANGVQHEPVDGIRIAWDYSSMQKLAPVGTRKLNWVGYPRVRRLQNGTLITVYETGRDVELVRSLDNGKTWDGPEIIFPGFTVTFGNDATTEIRMANPELIQLQNGDLVIACNYRPVKHEITPFAIAIKRSTDDGYTWTETQVIYEAGPRFRDGCWEPAMLQLPGGELQVYFANEAPYTHSDEQEISMVWSHDNGLTWSEKAKTVCFRPNRRDGMPVPLLVDGEILVAIEDNKIGQFKPYLVRTLVSDNWSQPVQANSPFREYALKDSLPDHIYAGAPYIMRVPSGEVLLAYQTTSGRTDEWEMSTLEVAVGDKKGRNFEKLSRPFDVPLTREAKWNSISLWDDNTVVAAATTSFRSRNCEVWIILGHIIPEIKVIRKPVKVDGDVSEWNETFPVFIGSLGETNVAAHLAYDHQNLYFSAKVKDQEIVLRENDPAGADGVGFYIHTGTAGANTPDSDSFRVWCSAGGGILLYQGTAGIWKEIPSDQVSSAARVLQNEGYQLELAVPFSLLQVKDKKSIRITAGLANYSEDGSGYVEHVIHSLPDAPKTWLKADFH